MTAEDAPLYPELALSVERAVTEFHLIAGERRAALGRLAEYVEQRLGAGEAARLTFICTHNSRRSQMSQIWAQTAARYFGVPAVETFSGGTETAAFNPRAVAALERAGLRIDRTRDGDNPVYEVRFHEEGAPMRAFSKVYRQEPNPSTAFCAVMTCAQADRNCPLVLGATARIAIPYDDPKAFDGTDRESAAYDERCRQIACEMVYLFSRVSLSVRG